jgi:hypothetical protein
VRQVEDSRHRSICADVITFAEQEWSAYVQAPLVLVRAQKCQLGPDDVARRGSLRLQQRNLTIPVAVLVIELRSVA